MAQFEKQHIYPYIKNKSMRYLRYIDNMFMIWTGTKQELLFLESLNSKHKTINFKHNIWHNNISFLDILKYKDKTSTLQTPIYHKPTDQQLYVHALKGHAKSLKNIQYSHASRIKTICSTLVEYKKHSGILTVDNTDQKDSLRKKLKSNKDSIHCLVT